VRLQIHRLLQAPAKCTVGLVHGPESELIQERAQVLASQWMKLEVTKQDEALKRILKRVVVSPTAVAIEVEKSHCSLAYSVELQRRCRPRPQF
jgi:hypothetical protein